MTSADLSGLRVRLEHASDLLASEPARAVVELRSIATAARRGADTDKGRWAVVGAASYLLARASLESGELNVALEQLDEAAAAHRRAGDQLSAERTTLGRMHVLDALGRHMEAIDLAMASTGRLAALDDTDEVVWLRAALQENTGVASGLRGLHRAALTAFDAAETAYQDLGAEEDLLRVKANVGVELIEVGRFSDAIGQLAGVAEEFIAAGDHWWYGVASTHLSRAHLAVGATERASDVAESALKMLESLGAETEAVRARLVLGASLIASGRHERAANIVIPTMRAAAANGQRLEQGQSWLLVGLLCADRGHLVSARTAFSKSYDIHVESGQIRAAARAALCRAELAEDEQQLHTDVDWVEKVLEPCDAPLEHARIALVVAPWKPLAERELLIDKAMALCGRHAPVQMTNSLESHKATLLKDRGDFDAAATVLRAAARRESRRTRLMSLSDLWQSQRCRTATANDELMSLLVERDLPGDLSEAFELAERDKARGVVRQSLQSNGSPADDSEADCAAVSWRVAGSKLLGFTTKGHLVDSVAIDSRAAEAAVSEVNQAVGSSIVTGCGEPSALRLLDALDRLGHVIELPRLIEAAVGGERTQLSASPDGCLLGVPIGSLGGASRTQALIERPTLSWSAAETNRLETTLVVDTGSIDLAARDAEIAAIVASADDVTVSRNVSSFGELAELVAVHDVVHLIGHAVARRDRAQRVPFVGWELSPGQMAELDLVGSVVVLNVCSGHSSGAILRHEPEAMSIAAIAGGASAVIASHWPVVDSGAATAAAAIHSTLRVTNNASDAVQHTRAEMREQFDHPLHWAGWSVRSLSPVVMRKELVR